MKLGMSATKVPNLASINYAARSLRIEWQELTETMKQHAIVEASGPYTEADLRSMDHPYARRHGTSLLPLLPININTGRLLRSLRVMRRKTGDGTVWQLQFTAPHSKFVLAPEGTKYMLPRGYWVRMQERYREELRKLMRRSRIYGRA